MPRRGVGDPITSAAQHARVLVVRFVAMTMSGMSAQLREYGTHKIPAVHNTTSENAHSVHAICRRRDHANNMRFYSKCRFKGGKDEFVGTGKEPFVRPCSLNTC